MCWWVVPVCVSAYYFLKLGGYLLHLQKPLTEGLLPIQWILAAIKQSNIGEQQEPGLSLSCSVVHRKMHPVHPNVFPPFFTPFSLHCCFWNQLFNLYPFLFFSVCHHLCLTFSSSSLLYHSSLYDRERENAWDRCQSSARWDRQLAESEWSIRHRAFTPPDCWAFVDGDYF